MMRNLKTYILTSLLFTAVLLHGQVNSSAFYSNDHNLENAAYFPSQLGMDRSAVQIDFAGAYGYLNNTSFSFNYARRLIGQAVVRNEDINQLSERIDEDNQFFAGAHFRPLEVAFTLNDNLSVAVGSRIKSEARFSYQGQLLDVLWNGNSRYAGQEVNLGSVSALFEYPVEIYSSFAYSLPNWDNLKLRVGARPKIITSYASFQIEEANASLFTEENGKYLELNYNFLANTALPDNENGENLIRRRATTFSMDLGATGVLLNRFHFSASLLDVGRLKYNDSPTNYSGNGTVKFEGAEIFTVEDGINVNDSSIINEFDYNTTSESFTTPLPTRIGLQAMYRVPKEKNNGRQFYKFSAGMTLIQGLSPQSTYSDNTFLSFGANYNPWGIVNFGTNINTYNLNKWGWGMNLSARFLIFHIGLGTTNILPIFTSRAGLYSDFQISAGLNF